MYIYEQIAHDCKDKLQSWSARTEILPREWAVLKHYGFPFDLPKGQLTECMLLFTPIEIRNLDSTPLIKLLIEEFGLGGNVDQTDINNIKDYAWSHIEFSISHVWGG